MKSMTHSRLFEGAVRHRRHQDGAHKFNYSLNLVLLDLDELEELPSHLPWRGKRWAPRSFRRSDYFGAHDVDLKDAVRNQVVSELGFLPEGRILLLTQLRSFGYLFNPVSFYLCHDNSNQLVAVIAEITNTPWRERHAYTLDARSEVAQGNHSWSFEKEFHVSPFHGMDHVYHWRLQLHKEGLVVAMVNEHEEQRVFDVTLDGSFQSLNRRGVARQARRSPFQSQRLHFAIYWHALRLFLKRATFHCHPRKVAASIANLKTKDHVNTHSS
jgi:DUF1365 family protein